MFEPTTESATHNANLLRKYDFNYRQAVRANKGSVITPGSEFRSLATVSVLWQHRFDWFKIKRNIYKGIKYPLRDDPPEPTRISDLLHMMFRGNHPSANDPTKQEILLDNYSKETRQTFMIPIPTNIFTKIAHLEMTPLAIAEQPTITAEGHIGVKNRSIHDCSYPMQSGHSLNDQNISELLDECHYGFCLHRLLHNLHRLRQQYPTKTIYICKYDLDAAYRRLHVHPDHAVRATTIVDNIGYLLLRLPFGVVAGPSAYSLVSEAIFDLANDLIRDPEWDPNTLQSPNAKHLHSPTTLDLSISYSTVKDLLVHVPLNHAFCDGYIDDLISFAVDIDDYVQRSQQSLPLISHSIFRPIHTDDPIHRKDTLSLRKLEGEGRPDERKTILGWDVCTRSFRISLATDKYKRWTMGLDKLIQNESKIRAKEIESTVGRLNHVGQKLPIARYFLNRLRLLHQRCLKYGPQKFNPSTRADIRLWKELLYHATFTGININNVTFTVYDTLIYTDACETGIGGYNPSSGRAWRYKLSPQTQNLHINSLEFLAALIGIWLELILRLGQQQKILCMTDNSSALAWLHKGNFHPIEQPIHETISRKLARLLIQHNSFLNMSKGKIIWWLTYSHATTTSLMKFLN